MSKYLDFIIAAIALNAKSKKIRVLDFYVTSWEERYDSVNKTMTNVASDYYNKNGRKPYYIYFPNSEKATSIKISKNSIGVNTYDFIPLKTFKF